MTDKSKEYRSKSYEIGGWKTYAAVILFIVGAVVLLGSFTDRAVRVKPATGSAQAMALSADRAAAPGQTSAGTR